MAAEPRLHHQLELLGLEGAREMAELAPSRAAAARYRNLIDSAHELRSDLPTAEDLSFQLHYTRTAASRFEGLWRR